MTLAANDGIYMPPFLAGTQSQDSSIQDSSRLLPKIPQPGIPWKLDRNPSSRLRTPQGPLECSVLYSIATNRPVAGKKHRMQQTYYRGL